MEKDTVYALQVRCIKDISFQKIRNIAKNFVLRLKHKKDLIDEYGVVYNKTINVF